MSSSSPQAETMEKLINQAFPSFALLAGMQLDLFTPLKDGALSARQLADALGVGPTKLELLLYPLVAAGLLTVEGDLFLNTAETDRFLVQGRPDYIGNRHGETASRYANALKTADSVRTGTAQAMTDFSTISRDRLEVFSRNRHQGTLDAGRDLVTRYDFSSHRRLLDVGGGTGGLSLSVADACPQIEATVVELPLMVPITRQYLEEAKAGQRVQVIEADVVGGDLTGSFDVAVLRWFVQVFSAHDAERAIKNVARVVEPGGVIFILGNVLDDSHLTPEEMLWRNLILLNVYDGGQAYTESQHRAWLSGAGFQDIARLALPNQESIIRAQKAG